MKHSATMCSLPVLLIVGAAIMGNSEALRIHLPQPWIRPSFGPSSLSLLDSHWPTDNFLLNSIFDDPFPRFHWPRTSLHEKIWRKHQCLSDGGVKDAQNNKILEQEKELDRKEAELREQRLELERQKEARILDQKRQAEEQRLQLQIQKEREEIARREEALREQEHRRRAEQEEYARREREWVKRQRLLKEEQRRRQAEEKAREEERQKLERERRIREHERLQKQGNFGNHRNQRHSQTSRPEEIVSLLVKGYDPDDINIVTKGNKMTVTGRHVCRCDENCFEREFQRVYTLPRGTDTRTLKANIDVDGHLRIRGEQAVRNNVDSFIDSSVSVTGAKSKLTENHDVSCGGRKIGLKLKKMNKRTGEIVEDYDLYKPVEYNFEDENEDDGITIEVVD